jgi:hypothetical protein
MKFTAFLNEIEQYIVKQTGDDTWTISDEEVIIGTIKRYPDDGGYFKGSINTDKVYKGPKTSTKELSIGNVKKLLIVLWKKYQNENSNRADVLLKLQDEYNNLLSQLDDNNKKIVNDFLKSKNSNDEAALTAAIGLLQKKYNLTVKDDKK